MIEIKDTVLQIIDQCYYDDRMKELATSFIDYKEKEGFRFAELVLFHYDLFGGKDKEIVKVAAGIELLILAIDIFDDLVDQDNPNPPWTSVSPATVTHVAIGLLIASQKAIDECHLNQDVKQEAKKILNDHSLRCMYGQQKDFENVITTEDDYLRITKEKSGALISSACLLGSIFANKQHVTDVKKYAEYFGIAVQISNDINDIQRETKKNDLLHKKKTLPILYLLQNKDPQFNIIKDYYNGKVTTEIIESLQQEIITNIKKSGAIEYAKVMMQFEISKAQKCIDAMDIPTTSKEKIVEFLLK